MNSLLLDADIILSINSRTFWAPFLQQNQIYASSTVVNECIYPNPITPLIDNGSIQKLYGEVPVISSIVSEMDTFGIRLDDGELESIAIIKGGQYPDLKFCSSDKAAITALSILGIDDKGISLEQAFINCGMRNIPRLLEPKHLHEYFNKHIRAGKVLLIQNSRFKGKPN